MSNQVPLIIDCQSIFEKLNNSINLELDFFCMVFRVMKSAATDNILFVFHFNNIPKRIHKIVKRAGFKTAYTSAYSAFNQFLSYNSILLTYDKIFYQLLTYSSDARIANTILRQTVFYKQSYISFLYGKVTNRDMQLYATLQESKRCNLEKIPGNMKSCIDFNRRKYISSPSHRFFQRPEVFNRRKQISVINFDYALQYDFPELENNRIEETLDEYLPSILPFWKRVYKRIQNSKKAKELHEKGVLTKNQTTSG